MPSAINTNLNSLVAQRQLGLSATSLGTSIQRLSSGLRINSAKDDAAGLAISERLTTQIKGSNQAARNVNDGISLAQTAEGGYAGISANLQRMRELAVQSANATNSSNDRAALQAEFAQLSSEIDRVASQTEFNGVKLLNGNFVGQQLQVGANANESIGVAGIIAASAAVLGSRTDYTTNISLTSGVSPITGTINGITIPATVNDGPGAFASNYSALANANAINSISALTGVTADATYNPAYTMAFATAAGGAYSLNLNGVNVSGVTTANASTAASEIVAAVNAASGLSGVTAQIIAGNWYELDAPDGRNIVLNPVTSGATGLAATVTLQANNIKITSHSSTSVTLGGNIALRAGSAGPFAPTIAATPAINSLDISTAGGANAALSVLDTAIGQVSTARANLGALQNRLSSTIDNLQSSGENLSASRGRIVDADFAQETANLSRAQILQQAGTAMVAQANQSPQGVLALLR